MTSIDMAGATGARDLAQPSASDAAHTILLNRVSWGAIFAGVVVGLVVQVLLTMLGVGIGAATINPATSGTPDGSTFSILSGVWYVASGIIAAFAGGYIAARMSGKTVATTGALHGLTTWAFTTLLVLYLLSTAVGGIVGGTFSGVAGAVGGLGKTAAEAAAPMLENVNPIDVIREPDSGDGQRSGGAERVRDERDAGSGDRRRGRCGSGAAAGGAGARQRARHPARPGAAAGG